MLRWVLIGMAATAGGCDTQKVFLVPEGGLSRMLHQPRYDPYEASSFFADGRTMQAPPAGTIANDEQLGEALQTGIVDGRYLRSFPIRVDVARLQRGHERFEIFCAACHGVLGNGQSVVAKNMPLVRPPSLHSQRILNFPPGRIFRVITSGYGLMPSYRVQLSTPDRWAVVAYVKALQLSQRASLPELPEEVQHAAERALSSATPEKPPPPRPTPGLERLP